MKRLFYVLAFSIIVTVVTWSLAFAGGWAVVTLDYLPMKWVSNEPVTIGFMVRQHGQTPIDGLTPSITARNSATGESYRTTAKGEGARGHYTAALNFPSAGTWEWSIDAFSFPQPMPSLNVLAPGAVQPSAAAPAPVQKAASPTEYWFAAVVAGVFGMIGAAFFWFVTRKRVAAIVFALAAVIALGGLGASQVTATTSQTTSTSPREETELVETGRNLFVAKGCIVCHVNAEAKVSRGQFSGLEFGPDLTNTKRPKEFLYVWLKDPSAVKPGTQMPNLGLDEGEIKALAAFLTADDTAGAK